MQKLILTSAMTYAQNPAGMSGLRIMVNSALRNVPDAQIMVVCDEPLPLPESVTQVWVPNLPGEPVCSRWGVYANLLRYLPASVFVMAVDGRDVVFNADPTDALPECRVSLCCEHADHRADQENANATWLRELLGFMPQFTDCQHAIACAGFVAGPCEQLQGHVRDMASMMQTRNGTRFGADQAAHNVVARWGKRHYSWLPNGAPVLHCALLPRGESVDGAAVVHQYDRVPELASMYHSRYGEVAT